MMDVSYLQRTIGLQAVEVPAFSLGRKTPLAAVVGPQAEANGQNGFSTAARNGEDATTSKPCSLTTPSGFGPCPVVREGHPPWLQPSKGVDTGLRAMNSLTGEKESFLPMEGKKVRWYTCGPTVYDVAHMGHARAYLTFDILRRIMTEYFGYDLSYQINITDIDDKIILRSRQNKLFDDFCKEAEEMPFEDVQKEVEAAMAVAEQKLLAKRPSEPAASATSRVKEEYEKLLAEHQLKLGQHEELRAKVTAASEAGLRQPLLEVARDPMMAKLDKAKGHTISDHAIFDSHARRFEDEYFHDMEALGVIRPDVVTRITEYMDGRVQRFIERLEDLGVAYESQGSIYFSIDEFKKRGYEYRKLVPATTTTAAEMEEGEGALAAENNEKRNPNDFAVWKKSKPGEPAWESRWGLGRPGWHIECSVMATDVQGDFLDIHAGGEDLKFPHHDNEMAQSEAYLGRPQWVNYFWHAGHLHIEGLKMSKSLKNFITIRQALEMHSARQLRMMFLMQPWDKGMNYSDQAIEMAKDVERKTKHFLGRLRFHLRQPNGQGAPGELESGLTAAVAACSEAVGAALRDNFNTREAVEALSKLREKCYASFEALPQASLEPVQQAAKLMESTFGMFGIQGLVVSPAKDEAAWTEAIDALASLREDVRRLARAKAGAEGILEAVDRQGPAVASARGAGLEECAGAIERFQQDLRSLAKAEKTAASAYFQRCDAVRDKDCVELGVRLEDTGVEGFIWMFEERKVLLREQAERAAAEAVANKAKVENKLKQKEQELKTAEKASVAPKVLFQTGANKGAYSEFDENGVPMKLADGTEVSAKKKKDLVKELNKQKAEFEKLAKQAGAAGVPALLEKLLSEVEELKRQVN